MMEGYPRLTKRKRGFQFFCVSDTIRNDLKFINVLSSKSSLSKTFATNARSHFEELREEAENMKAHQSSFKQLEGLLRR